MNFKNLIPVVIIVFCAGLVTGGMAQVKQLEQATKKVASEEKPTVERSSKVTLKAVVDKVDYKARTITLKDDEGNTQSFNVRNSSVPLEKLKVGDKVTLTIHDQELTSVTSPGQKLPEEKEVAAVASAVPHNFS